MINDNRQSSLDLMENKIFQRDVDQSEEIVQDLNYNLRDKPITMILGDSENLIITDEIENDLEEFFDSLEHFNSR